MWDPGDAGGKGPVLFAVHGQGVALPDDARGGRKGGQGQPDPVQQGDGGPAWNRHDPGVPAGGEGPLGAGVGHPSGAAADGTGTGGNHGHGIGEPLPAGHLHAGVQRGVRARRARAGIRVRAAHRAGPAGEHPVRDSRALGGAGQLCEIRGAGAAAAVEPAPSTLHAGAGEGPAAHGREPVGMAWAKAAAKIRDGWPAAAGIPGGGRLGWAQIR